MYRASLTGEHLGWVIHKSESTFALVHRVQVDPTRGPVVIIDQEVWEVDETDDVYLTEEAAREAYYR